MPQEHDEMVQQYMTQIIKRTLDPKPYNKLMIYYRKEKNLKKELEIINKAITIFSDVVIRPETAAAVKRLSESIGVATGLMDRNGKQLYVPEPVQKWLRRKEIVNGKIAAFSKKAQNN